MEKEKDLELKNNNFKEENKILNRAKKKELTYEELTASYGEVVDNFKTVYSVSKRLNKKFDKVISEKDLEITELENKLHKSSKLGISTGILLVLAGFVIAGIGIFLM